MKKQHTKRELAQTYILRNRSLATEDRLTQQEIADKAGLTLMQVCDIQSRMAEADAPHTAPEADARAAKSAT